MSTVALVIIFGIVLFLLVVVPLWLVSYLVHKWTSGAIEVITPLPTEAVITNAVRGFAELGWFVKEERSDWVLMEKAPSGGTGCLLLILFWPVGLAYLLSDWGKGKLVVAAGGGSTSGGTDVEMTWRNAPIRADAEEFCAWLQRANDST